MEKPRVTIKRWHLHYSTYRGGMELVGEATGHPVLGNSRVYTSRVIHIDIAKMEVETLNTIYVLEKPDEVS